MRRGRTSSVWMITRVRCVNMLIGRARRMRNAGGRVHTALRLVSSDRCVPILFLMMLGISHLSLHLGTRRRRLGSVHTGWCGSCARRSLRRMMTVTLAESHAQVSAHLRYHAWLYYIKAEPALTDAEFDRDFKYLQGLEGRHPELVTPDSPTQVVGSPVEEPPCPPELRGWLDER